MWLNVIGIGCGVKGWNCTLKVKKNELGVVHVHFREAHSTRLEEYFRVERAESAAWQALHARNYCK
jgi:hypothetical protein